MADWPYCWPWPIIRAEILERDDHLCRIKGPKCTGDATDVDHIVPPDEGGAAWDHDNLRAACAPCNRGRSQSRLAAMAKLNKRPAPAASRDW